MRKSLTKAEILRNKREIKALFSSGRRVACRGMKLVYRKNDEGINRVLIVTVRKYGTAVERNRSKRIIREVYRHVKSFLRQGYDCAVVLYPYPGSRSVRDYRFRERADQIIGVFRRAGLLNESIETIRMAFPGYDLDL